MSDEAMTDMIARFGLYTTPLWFALERGDIDTAAEELAATYPGYEEIETVTWIFEPMED